MELRVIIFEDDEGIRKLLSLLASQEGHEVLSFPNPSVCPLYLEAECDCSQVHACGDLLITDNNMSLMTGLDFIRKQLNGGCKGVVENKAVLSAGWTPKDLEMAQKLKCKIFYKPFNSVDILNWIEERKKHIDPNRKLISLT